MCRDHHIHGKNTKIQLNFEDTQMVFLKDFFVKVDFEKIIRLVVFFLPKIKVSSLSPAPSSTHMPFCVHVGMSPTSFVDHFFYLCLSLTYCLVCVLHPYGQLLASRRFCMWCFLVLLSLSIRCPGSGMVLDCIDS